MVSSQLIIYFQSITCHNTTLNSIKSPQAHDTAESSSTPVRCNKLSKQTSSNDKHAVTYHLEQIVAREVGNE
jgi:hypothetical protein